MQAVSFMEIYGTEASGEKHGKRDEGIGCKVTNVAELTKARSVKHLRDFTYRQMVLRIKYEARKALF